MSLTMKIRNDVFNGYKRKKQFFVIINYLRETFQKNILHTFQNCRKTNIRFFNILTYYIDFMEICHAKFPAIIIRFTVFDNIIEAIRSADMSQSSLSKGFPFNRL